MQDQLYEEARQRELAQAKEKIKKANKRAAEAEEKTLNAKREIEKLQAFIRKINDESL